MLHELRASLWAALLLAVPLSAAAQQPDAAGNGDLALLDIVAERGDFASGTRSGWAQAFAVSQADADQWRGVVAGYDRAIDRLWRAGVALAASGADGAGASRQVHAALHGSGRVGQLDLAGGLLFGRVNRSGATGEGSSRGAFLALGHDLASGEFWRARLDGRATWLRSVDDADVRELRAGISFMRAGRDAPSPRLVPYLRIGMRQLALPDAGDRVGLYGGLGLIWEPSRRIAWQIGYRGLWMDDVQTHELRAGFSAAL